MTAVSLEAIGVCKRFGQVVALDDVSVRVRPGRIHALLGENGAGKSTLVKCLMGTYQADAGRFLVDGQPHHSRTPREAHAAGIGMVYQHFTLVPEMTVLENLMLARPDIPFAIDWGRYRQELGELLETMPFRVRLDAPVASLAAGEKQKVEILKQLHLRRRLLVLDEPTSVLTPAEADEMLGLLRDLAHGGALTVVLITHKFREVLAFADDVTVLRFGRVVASAEAARVSAEELAERMVGRAGLAPAVARATAPHTANRLEARRLTVLGDTGLAAVRGLDLTVAGGEIVGIAGVSGNGQRELAEALAGQRAVARGEIRVHDAPFRPTRRFLAEQRVACLPEEPLHNACVRRDERGREFGPPSLRHGADPRAVRVALETRDGGGRPHRDPGLSHPHERTRGAGLLALGRQCAAPRAGAGARAGMQPAARQQSVFRPRLRRRPPASMTTSWPRAMAGRPCC